MQVDSSGFKMVSYKKKTIKAASTLILLNTCIHCVLEFGPLTFLCIILKTERCKTLSVPHFSPKVTTNDMENSQKGQLRLNKLNYIRLTQNFMHSSFHVLILEDEYLSLTTPMSGLLAVYCSLLQQTYT
jgi:hypothetical protein